MLDPNARPSAIPDLDVWRARIRRLAARADVIRASTDDLAVLGPGDPLEVAQELAGRRAVVLVSDGPRPVRVLVAGSGSFELQVPAGPVVDTVGAGDAFGGGFLAWWVERSLGRSELGDQPRLREATAFALEVAAITCSRPGAEPPRLSELGRSPRG
jgi:fructokinase